MVSGLEEINLITANQLAYKGGIACPPLYFRGDPTKIVFNPILIQQRSIFHSVQIWLFRNVAGVIFLLSVWWDQKRSQLTNY